MEHTKTAKTNIAGFQLGSSSEGQGHPALVIGSSVYYPRTFSSELRRHFRLHFIDHKGFVPPPPGHFENSFFSMDNLIADIETMRKSLSLESFVIIGHSGHAFMALEYAKKYPQHIEGVVLLGVVPNYSPESHEAGQKYFEEFASTERKEALNENLKYLGEEIAANPEQRFITYCLRMGPKSWYDIHFDATHLWRDVYTNMQVFDYVWGEVFRNIDITQGLEDFKIPVFLGLGRFDFLTGPPSLWDKVLPYFKNIECKIYEKSSHTPQLEESELFDRDFLNWFQRISKLKD